MKGIKICAIAAMLAVILVSSSCGVFRRSKDTAKASAPRSVLILPPPKEPPIQTVSLSSPPELAPQEPGAWMPPPTEERFPPAPQPPKRARVRETAEAPAAQPEPAAPLAQVPQLEQILTPEQQQAYNDEIDRNIMRAQRTVAALDGRRLSGEQRTYLDRIRTFLQQASEARKSDLFRARNLAERASLLAEDLAKSLQ
ncbi:MAG TPA: hypothetical protein PLA43_18115 [Bryobacteraceae bacterium]|nr:hypothetical protein [Bryobacteraceae bacterium]HOQ47343.1 hypothetical protein [Bryobacteraceae bacterium]HPQ14009.1 hypothetical protein [Bryobacteraceae bacterium]HPU73872.1 hypothetical protein [Bryobacteraceae bacterium]